MSSPEFTQSNADGSRLHCGAGCDRDTTACTPTATASAGRQAGSAGKCEGKDRLTERQTYVYVEKALHLFLKTGLGEIDESKIIVQN